MTKIETLHELLIEQVRELYNAEKQQRNVLTDFGQLAHNRELRLVIQNHLIETEQHIRILEDLFHQMDVTSFGEYSEPMKALIKEGYALIGRSADLEISDIMMVVALQYMEHFEIAGYSAVRTIAGKLGMHEAADQLDFILGEEKRIDNRFSQIAADFTGRKSAVPVMM